MKSKKRYTHVSEINDEITKARKLAKELFAQADDLERYSPSSPELDKLRTKAGNIEKNRIPYLIEKARELQTATFDFMPDGSVPS